MDIATLKSKVTANEEKIAKKQASIKKNEEKVIKLSADFKSKYGTSYDKFDTEAFGRECDVSDEKWNNVYIPCVVLIEKITRAKYTIENATKDIAKLEKVLEGWKEKLSKETVKDSKRDNPVIKAFLDNWETTCYKWLDSEYDVYSKAIEEFYNREDVIELENKYDNYNYTRKQRTEAYDDLRYLKSCFNNRFPSLVVKNSHYDKKEYRKIIKESLAKEKVIKYDDLIARVEYSVGNIVDAKGLKLAPTGNLNGIIIGDKGKVNLETIGAGGYNIQCFHYRTILHNVKD